MVEAARRRRGLFDSRDQAFASYRGRGAFEAWTDEMLADYLEDGMREAPGGGFALSCAPAWEASSYAAHGHDAWGAIAALSRPLHILKAASNSTCRLAEGQLSAPGGLAIEIVPETTHFLPMERPDVVREALTLAASR